MWLALIYSYSSTDQRRNLYRSSAVLSAVVESATLPLRYFSLSPDCALEIDIPKQIKRGAR